MTDRVYLDWNATAPLRPEARAAVLACVDTVGNPSSVHAEGRAARRLIEDARAAVAALVGAEPLAVVFTAGGTEANALALSPGWHRGTDSAPCDRLLVSAVEHPSVLAGGGFAPGQVEQIPVTSDGVVDLVAVETRLAALAAAGARAMVSVMLANNETGVIQPVAEVAARVRAAGVLLHVDAVQAAGKIPCDIKALGADLVTVSGHKLGGPKGAGAVLRRDQDLHLARPPVRGGGQERGLRAGTENVAAIAGFGAAAAAATAGLAAEAARIAALRDRLEAGLLARDPRVTIFGRGAPRLPNTTLFSRPGARAETQLIAFDLAGVAVSSGSACASGKVAASHVLAAMGVDPDLARGAIRVSLGWTTAEQDIDRFLDVWSALAPRQQENREIAA